MDWERVWPALVGGLMIGVASAGLRALTAKTAGISGSLGGILEREKGEIGWKSMIVVGDCRCQCVKSTVMAATAVNVRVCAEPKSGLNSTVYSPGITYATLKGAPHKRSVPIIRPLDSSVPSP